MRNLITVSGSALINNSGCKK